FFQAECCLRDATVTGVQTCALPIWLLELGREQADVAVCRRYVGLLSAELEKPTQATRLMVGIAELLLALEPHERAERAVVGLLTDRKSVAAGTRGGVAGVDRRAGEE